jgi:hypothetical protein
MPADVNDIGGLAKFTTPIRLLYRMLLGSALANIGASASVATAQEVVVVVPELKMVVIPALVPYWL